MSTVDKEEEDIYDKSKEEVSEEVCTKCDKRYRGAWEDKNGSGTLTTQNGTITLTQIFLT